MSKFSFDSIDIISKIDEGILDYAFTKNYREASMAPKSMRRIMLEISSLSTSLPIHRGSSIFVRVDESRPDVLKVLITGPDSTPYKNGCYEFDMFIPDSYPQKPRLVKFITTRGGTFRFNPNLYECGMVCLSLLGTWDGPSWDPNQSTILQVLISIQSLIFVDNPYYNEPGYEHEMHTEYSQRESKAYNDNIYQGNLRHAILTQIQRPSLIWTDVIQNHFELKREEIIKQCEANADDTTDATTEVKKSILQVIKTNNKQQKE